MFEALADLLGVEKKELALALIASLGGGAVGGLILSIVNHWLQNSRTDRERKREVKSKKLDLLYAPLVDVFESTWNPDDGYNGLNDSDFNAIQRIVRTNMKLADDKLINAVNRIAEEQHHSAISQVQYPEYDLDRRLINHVYRQFNKLKVDLKLKNKDYSIILRPLKRIWDQMYR